MSDYMRKRALKEEIESLAITISGVHSERNHIVNEYKKSVLKVIEEQPTVDEKEIIRKPIESIVERLEEAMPIQFSFSKPLITVEDAIKIVKEEGEL